MQLDTGDPLNPARFVNAKPAGNTAFAGMAPANLEGQRQPEETQALLDTLMSKAPIGLAFVDTNFCFVYINETLAQINGKPVGAHLGRTARELYPNGANAWEPLWQQVLDTGQPIVNMELEDLFDGLSRHWQVSYYPVRVGDGPILGIGVMVQEITERHRAEAERQQSLEREQAARSHAEEALALVDGLLNNAPVGISFFDTDLRYTGISANLAAMNGFPREAHIGRTPAEMAGYAASLVEPVMREVLRSGEPTFIEVSHATPADPEHQDHWIVNFYPLRRADSTVIGLGGVRVSIGERKRAEERQRLLAEASQVLASSFNYGETLDLVGKLIVPHLADWCCVDLVNDDGIIELVAVSHTQPDQAKRIRELRARYPLHTNTPHGVAMVIHSGQTEHVNDMAVALSEIQPEDEEQRAAIDSMHIKEILTVPLTTRNQIIGAISCVLTDPARSYNQDDVLLIEELAQRCAQAVDNARLYGAEQAAVRTRDAFLSVAAHELKTPLTTLHGQAQLLQRRLRNGATITEREIQSIDRVVAQSRRLNRMIGDLLDLSRIESGQLTLRREPMDIGLLASQVVEAAQPIVAPHTLVLHAPDQPLMVVGDSIRLEQVLHNLISNAAKYSPGGDTITVVVEQRGTDVSISVRDYGIGIPAEALPRLFERFYRAPNAEQHRISGIGVGLYVVREIVLLHGGTIEVNSAEGGGSVFTLTLPLADVGA